MANVRRPEQLGLTLDHTARLGREDFIEGPSNASALHLIERWPDWPHRVVVLVGPEGAGKTHLAAIWATASEARTVAAGAVVHDDVPALLATHALVIDDLAPGSFDERTLFHLLNLARQEQAFVLIAARSQPAAWTVAIKDLASRLRALPVVTLSSPDDALLRAVIVKLCADRQLAVDESLVSYLVTRIERSFAAVQAAVATLDREALRQQRRVTRAFAVELFRDSDQPDLFGEDGGNESV